MMVILIVIGALPTVTGGLRNKRISGDHPNNSIVEISQNTEKSPGDLRKLVVTQTRVNFSTEIINAISDFILILK